MCSVPNKFIYLRLHTNVNTSSKNILVYYITVRALVHLPLGSTGVLGIGCGYMAIASSMRQGDLHRKRFPVNLWTDGLFSLLAISYQDTRSLGNVQYLDFHGESILPIDRNNTVVVWESKASLLQISTYSISQLHKAVSIGRCLLCSWF